MLNRVFNLSRRQKPQAFPPRKRTLATSCYGQQDHESPDDPIAAADDDAAPATRAAAGESAGEPVLADTRAPTDEPKLALGQMKASIEDGLVMVFGPEGDPVPPHVFAGAAAEQPDALVALADGTAVVARRLAMVLQAQTLGRLGPAEHDAWIMTMLLDRHGPEMASETDLGTEQERGAIEGRVDRLKIATPSGAFLIADAGPARTGEVTGLFLPDGTPISVVDLAGRLRGPRAEPCTAVDAPENATVTVGETEACGDPAEVDLSGYSVEFEADGVWLESAALAAVGGRINLARWAADAPNGPVVGISPAGGGTASLKDLCAALGIAREVATADPPSEIDDSITPKGDGRGPLELDPTSKIAAQTPSDDASGWTRPDIASTVPVLPQLEPDPASVAMTDESALDLNLLDAVGSLPAQTPDGLVTGLPERAFLSNAVDRSDGSGMLTEDLPDRSLPDPLESASDGAAITVPPNRDEASRTTVVGHATEEAPALSSGCADEIDPESIVLVIVRGVPDGARLSAGMRDDDGSWSLSSLDLPSVTIAPADGSADDAAGALDGELIITGIALGEDGALASFSETVPLADYLGDPGPGEGMVESAPGAALDPVRDPAGDPAGERSANPRPGAIALEVDPRIWHGQEFDALVIRDLPTGAGLSAGAYDPTIHGWVLRPRDLDGLTIRPPADQAAGFTLTVMGVVLRPGETNAARVLARLPVALAEPLPGSGTTHPGSR